MQKYQFNEEHHHAEGTGLFVHQQARDEVLWVKPDSAVHGMDFLVVRVMHGDKIAYYADAEGYMNAWYGEGYFHSAEMGQVDAVRAELIPFARKIGYDIPPRWLEGYVEPTSKNDIHVPWPFLVSLFRIHLMQSMVRRGLSTVDASKIIDDAITGEPTPEFVESVKKLVVTATAEYERKLREPKGPAGLVRKHIGDKKTP